MTSRGQENGGPTEVGDMWRALLSSTPWDLVVDCRAARGEMLLATDLPLSARVIAFEPDEGARRVLAENVTAAGLDVDLRAESLAPGGGPWVTLSEALLGIDAQTACLRVEGDREVDPVLEGGATFFGRLTAIAILLDVSRRDPKDLVRWARDWRMYVFDVRRSGFIRVGRRGPDDIRHLLDQPWVHRGHVALRNPRGL